ncbi:MAG: hypothetical protein J4F41_05085 [Alphaproteobacteria bacterium]|nr:hypothetical protein [Alphaproteobacteria bacterium]
MDLLKTSMDWTKTEMLSSAVFAFFGLLFLLASYGFWQYGKTDMAKAYVIPMLVVGVLLVILGVGLIIPNQLRLSGFPLAYNTDASAFVASELARVEKTMNGYSTAISRVFPVIILACAGLVMVVEAPIWRASLIAVIAMMAILFVVDTNANARLGVYKGKLLHAEQQL